MSTAIIIGAFIAALGLGAWCYAKCTADERQAGRAAIEKAAAEKAASEKAGREANERANFKVDVASAFEELVVNPDWLRGRSDSYAYRKSFMALREFFDTVSHLKHALEANRHLEETVRAQGKALREIRATQKDIQQALQMGQPIE